MADYYFKTEDLGVGYHGRAILEHVNIGLKKGEILTLVGPNGAGKSTILRSITRQLRIIKGRVAVGEKDLSDTTYQELAKKMAVVLTDRVRPELMTGHDIVATGRYPYTGRLGILSREDEEKVDEAMELVQRAWMPSVYLLKRRPEAENPSGPGNLPGAGDPGAG